MSARVFAVRMHARSSRDDARAKTHLMRWAGITQDANGQFHVPSTWVPEASVGLADVLMQTGEREPARRLIDTVLKSMDDEIRVRGRGEFWYLAHLSILYALLERDDEALAMLEKSFAQNSVSGLLFCLANDPAYDRLRSHPRSRPGCSAGVR